MEKYKILMLVLISLFASMSCYADAGITNESFTIFADVVSNGSFYPADSANVTVYLPNSSIFINNKEMINIEIGKFIYNYTPNESGTWYATANFYNSTGDIITVASQSFSVMDNVGDTVVGAFDMILMPFLIILIGILFAVLGQYLKNGMFFVVSGIWFMGSAASGLIFLNSTIPEMLMYFLVGLALIYHSYSFFEKNMKENKRMQQIRE